MHSKAYREHCEMPHGINFKVPLGEIAAIYDGAWKIRIVFVHYVYVLSGRGIMLLGLIIGPLVCSDINYGYGDRTNTYVGMYNILSYGRQNWRHEFR